MVVTVLVGVFEKMSDEDCSYCYIHSNRQNLIEFRYGVGEDLLNGSCKINKKTVRLEACKDFTKEFIRKLRKKERSEG